MSLIDKKKMSKSSTDKCHILEYGPAGIWRGPLCGSRNINNHGGIAVATCKRCLLIALKRANPNDYEPAIFRHSVQRARKMGIQINLNKIRKRG